MCRPRRFLVYVVTFAELVDQLCQDRRLVSGGLAPAGITHTPLPPL